MFTRVSLAMIYHHTKYREMLTIFPTLCISYPGLIYLATGSLYFLNSLTYFLLCLPLSPLSITHLLSVSVTLLKVKLSYWFTYTFVSLARQLSTTSWFFVLISSWILSSSEHSFSFTRICPDWISDPKWALFLFAASHIAFWLTPPWQYSRHIRQRSTKGDRAKGQNKSVNTT